jgi:DNA adenine methylase
LLNKPRAEIEVAGDLNAGVMTFYGCLRDRPVDLINRLRSIAYTQESFDWACAPSAHSDPIEAAARFLVRNRFSRGGLGKDFACSVRQRGGRPGDENAWMTILDVLAAIAARLQGVELYQGPALDLIERHDSRQTLFYLDPPYVHAARTSRNAYKHEMDNEAHKRLLKTILDARGMVILSGYHNSLYNDSLRSWERHEFEMPNHSGQNRTKNRRVEVIWMNPACDRFTLM